MAVLVILYFLMATFKSTTSPRIWKVRRGQNLPTPSYSVFSCKSGWTCALHLIVCIIKRYFIVTTVKQKVQKFLTTDSASTELG